MLKSPILPSLFPISAIVALLFAAHTLPAQPSAVLTLSENQGFCSGGGYKAATFPTWGSYCMNGDANVGRVVSQTFRLSGSFEIYLSGYPSSKDLSLRLENVSDHQALDIRPTIAPGESWLNSRFVLPDSWRGKDLRIVAEDRSTAWHGWLAFGSPSILRVADSLKDVKRLVLKSFLFVGLIFLPGFTLCAFAVSRRVHGKIKLGLILLAGIAIPGYLLFWVYLASPSAGYFISTALPYVMGGILLFVLRRLKHEQRRLLLQFLTPLGLTLFGTIGILSIGYLAGGLATPNATAQVRFSHPLPNDNEIPYVFAEGLRKGFVPKPLIGDWLSSDRPPLQAGMILALEPFMQSQRELSYHIASVAMQTLWIFAIWLLLCAFRIPRLTAAAVIVSIYLSGFAIVNSFYVWPKLLSAAYTIAFAVPLFAARASAPRSSWSFQCLLAFLLACGLLAHGGSLFALPGILLIALLRYRGRMMKEACLIAGLAFLLYSPWIAYQKFVDPPGDRLMKLHLAGVENPTHDPVLASIREAYRKQTLAQWLWSKQTNITAVFGHEIEYLREASAFTSSDSRARIRGLEFFFFLPALSFTGWGILGLLFRRVVTRPPRRREMNAAGWLLLCSFSMTIPWILVMYSPFSTIVHQGAYPMVLLAMAGSILALWAVQPWLAACVCILQCLFHWLVYQPSLAPATATPSLRIDLPIWMLILHLVALGGFFGMLVLPLRMKLSFRPISMISRSKI